MGRHRARSRLARCGCAALAPARSVGGHLSHRRALSPPARQRLPRGRRQLASSHLLRPRATQTKCAASRTPVARSLQHACAQAARSQASTASASIRAHTCRSSSRQTIWMQCCECAPPLIRQACATPARSSPTPRGCGEARAVAVGQMLTTRTQQEDGQSINSRAATDENGRDPQSNALLASQVDAPARQSSTVVTQTTVHPTTQPVQASFVIETAQQQLAALVSHEHITCTERTVTVAPASADEACAVMRLAAQHGWSVVPAGAATWLDVGAPRKRINLIITTRRHDSSCTP